MRSCHQAFVDRVLLSRKSFESIIDRCTVPSLALRTDLFLPFLSLEPFLPDLLSSIFSILFTSTRRLRMPSDCYARLTRWGRREGAIRLEEEQGPVIDEKEALPLYWHSPGVGEEEEEYTRTYWDRLLHSARHGLTIRASLDCSTDARLLLECVL